ASSNHFIKPIPHCPSRYHRGPANYAGGESNRSDRPRVDRLARLPACYWRPRSARILLLSPEQPSSLASGGSLLPIGEGCKNVSSGQSCSPEPLTKFLRAF